MGTKNRKPFQLSFPRANPEALKPYFQPAEDVDQPFTLEEIRKGLAGIWRGLGSLGLIDPENAMFIVKGLALAEESEERRIKTSQAAIRQQALETNTELVKARLEHQRLLNIKLAEEMNINSQQEPTNEYSPEGQDGTVKG